jgi:hypothetical protein
VPSRPAQGYARPMKPTALALLIAAGAFGASTIYLTVQLQAERQRADQVLAESRALSARVVELESLRSQLASVPRAGAGVFSDGAPGVAPLVEVPPPSSTADFEVVDMDVASSQAAMPSPEQSEVLRKMMRGQMRAHNKRLYADIGDKLGLTRDGTTRLIDLLTDQQVNVMNGARTPRTAGDWRQKQLAEIADLIGYDKIELFKEYQETLPARQEAAMISRQLEDLDQSLSESQRQRLVDAFADERKRVPMPEYVDGTPRELHFAALQAWQEEYAERTASRVRGILNTEQLASYNDYQQWSREMRSQFEARRPMPSAEGAVMLAEPVAIAVPAHVND